MAKFSGAGGEGGESFGASVLQGLMTGGDETSECPVCFEDMADGVLMPCMHSGCRSCVMEYLQVTKNKPMMVVRRCRYMLFYAYTSCPLIRLV